MDRVARLVHASGVLRRKIWASLPFGIRFADFFARLAVDTTESFGRGMFEIFAKHGIEDVPDPRGVEAKKFGIDAYRGLMSKFRDPSLVDDVMGHFVERFLMKGVHGLRPGTPLDKAKGYVLVGLKNDALNTLRKKHEVSDIYVEEGEEKRHEIPVFDDEGSGHADARAERMFMKLLPKVRSKLEVIHPDVPLYLKLSLEGYTAREIVGDIAHGVPSMLTHPYEKDGTPLTEKRWSDYKAPIKAVFTRVFGEHAGLV
jgi:hypothetical protein